MRLQNALLKFIHKESPVWKAGERVPGLLHWAQYCLRYRFAAAGTREIFPEFVSYCNLRCPLCLLDHDKPKKGWRRKRRKKF